MEAPAEEVARYLGRLRRRVLWLHLARGALAAFAAFVLLFALVGAFIGPTIGELGASVCWSVIALATVATGVWTLWPLTRERGDRIALRLRPLSTRLASAARSVVELTSGSGSAELRAAHAHSVWGALRDTSVREVVPLSTVWPPRLRFAVVAALFLAAALGLSGTSRLGGYALLNPGATVGDAAVADIVSRIEWRCRMPAYLGLAEVTLDSPSIELPVGTLVEVALTGRIDLAAPRLTVADVPVSLQGEKREWTARFEVRESGPIVLEARNIDGLSLRDASPRALIAIEDNAPEIELDDRFLPEGASEALDPRADLVIPYLAQDDHGLSHLRLVVRTPDGEVIRRDLFHSSIPVPEEQGMLTISVAETGARAGDAIHIWVEGSDHDDVTGPNVGRSDDLRLVVASESARRDAVARSLAELTGRGLDALADRLERNDHGEAARFELVSSSSDLFRAGLDLAARSELEGIDASVLGSMAVRLGRMLTQERRAHQGRPVLSAVRRIDVQLVELLETQILFLADLESQVRLDDAAAIARELDALRREMTSLLEELRRTDSAEAREELLAAIARAQARLQELSARLAAMNADGPSEFLNMQSVDQEATSDALSGFEQAVREGDLDRAERELMELQRQIDQLAGSLDSASGSFGESRFGPRETAMAEAMDRLAGLETEQRQLSGRTDATRRAAADAALEAAGTELAEVARRLERSARETAEALRAVPEEQLSPFDADSRELAIARLDDASAALAAGDLAEARAMSAAAQRSAERLARELELSALMYPGRAGGTLAAARSARAAATATGELGRGLDDALPRVREHIEEAGRVQLRTDSPRQSAAGAAAESLAELFRSEPDGTALSPESADAVDRAVESMRSAERAMGQVDPMGAARAQAEAARELSELRDRLEQQQQQQQGGGGGSSSTPRERVELPGARERDNDRRRELLDAMQRSSPPGFEDANRRYYEGLLR